MTTAAVWQSALDQYRYPVDLSGYSGKASFPGWFNLALKIGDRTETLSFEDRFRMNAEHHLEAWYEVVYWKLYGTKVWREKCTQAVASRMKGNGTRSVDLWDACCYFVERPTKASFKGLQKLIFVAPVIAVTATFPAFVAPNLFPMVDTRVAKWVTGTLNEPEKDWTPQLPRLIAPVLGQNGAAVLTFSDWPFVESWIEWSRAVAGMLSEKTGNKWRPRDVDMAVFQAWGSKGMSHPVIALPAL